jgi:hypothetical protein
MRTDREFGGRTMRRVTPSSKDANKDNYKGEETMTMVS